jgi:hypothetical protein
MSIEIGGAIRESDLEELLGLVTDGEIYDMYSGTAVRDYWRVVQASKKDLLLYLDQPIKIKDESPISSSILSDILKDTVKVMEP